VGDTELEIVVGQPEVGQRVGGEGEDFGVGGRLT